MPLRTTTTTATTAKTIKIKSGSGYYSDAFYGVVEVAHFCSNAI